MSVSTGQDGRPQQNRRAVFPSPLSPQMPPSPCGNAVSVRNLAAKSSYSYGSTEKPR